MVTIQNPTLDSQSEPITKLQRLSPLGSISECLCIELCAGSARLSASLKEIGFSVVPVDYEKNRHQSYVRCIRMDLTKPGAKTLFSQLLSTGRVVYVHSAPPCGTGSRARERPISQALKALGAPEPYPLRSDSHPLGLPTLSGSDLQRVQAANAIYAFCGWAMQQCLQLNILCSAENPRSAYMWQIQPWPMLLNNDKLEIVDHQVCMLGGKRNKWSRWLATRALLSSLKLTCDGTHEHEPWGVSKSLGSGWQFATAEEAEYPKVLCQRVAQLVHAQVVSDGAIPVPGGITEPGLTDKQRTHLSRAATGKLPRGRTLPQLVSEFSHTSEEASYVPCKSSKLLRQYFKMGNDGSQVSVSIVGHFREPAEFLKAAVECKHPIDMLHGIEDFTKKALFNLLVKGPDALIR